MIKKFNLRILITITSILFLTNISMAQSNNDSIIKTDLYDTIYLMDSVFF